MGMKSVSCLPFEVLISNGCERSEVDLRHFEH